MKDEGCSIALSTMVCQRFAEKQHYFWTLGKLGVCALLANSAFAADPPQNVTSKLYSSTAGEIFWDRVSGPIIGYELTRNGVNLGVVDGNSFFDDTLQADTRYTYTVASVEADETRSTAVSTEFGPFEPATDILSEFRVEVYSSNAAELFWNRPQTTGLEYAVTFNDGQVFNTDGTSLYLDSLDSGTLYDVSIRATNLTTGVDSPVRQLQFTTGGGFVPGLASPANVNVVLYSSTAAEVFWDRVNDNAPQYELSLNGVLLNDGLLTYATSVYLDSLEPGSTNIFSVVAVDEKNNQRSNPVDISFEAMPGTTPTPVPPIGSPINADNAIDVLSLSLTLMSRNGHNEVKDALSKIRFIDAENPISGFTLAQTESFENGGTRFFRDTYECGDGGRLMLETPRNAFGDADLLFEDCAASDTIRNGSVGFTFDGTTLFTDYLAYSELRLASNSRENLTIKLDGQAVDGTDRIGSRAVEAVSGLDYFRDTRAGEQQITGMQQAISASSENFPRNTFDTSFVVEAFWTKDSTLEVETLIPFRDIDTDSGRYTVGLLRITDLSAPGNYLEFDIATGQSDTFQLTVVAENVVTSELRDWDDLSPLELPCVLVGNPEDGPEICR